MHKNFTSEKEYIYTFSFLEERGFVGQSYGNEGYFLFTKKPESYQVQLSNLFGWNLYLIGANRSVSHSVFILGNHFYSFFEYFDELVEAYSYGEVLIFRNCGEQLFKAENKQYTIILSLERRLEVIRNE